jgi:AraC-like DNA-binding protein
MMAGANRVTSRATGPSEGLPPVATAQFRAYVDAFERLGYDVAALLAAVGVRRTDLDDPDALIPCETCGRLFQCAMQSRRLANVGIRLGAVVPIGTFPLLDYLALSSDDVGQACRQCSRFVQLVGSPFPLEIDDTDDPIRVVCLTSDPGMRFGVAYSISLMVHHLREETDPSVAFEYVSLMHEPDDRSEVERILGCRVRAQAAWSGVALSREAWTQPMRRRDSVLRSMLEDHATEVAAKRPMGDPLIASVRRALVRRIGRGDDSVEAIARELAMSPRTLQRRLSEAGVSYQELSDQLHREVAEKHLTDSRLSIAEVAYLLGYSEPAAFHRAFKRWNGVTPQEFRRGRR